MTTSSTERPSKIYPNRDIWFENMTSGNPRTSKFKLLNAKMSKNSDIVNYLTPTQWHPKEARRPQQMLGYDQIAKKTQKIATFLTLS
jgi:hypothetical protein